MAVRGADERDGKEPVTEELGGYRCSDYWKLGLPLLGLYALVAIGVAPVFRRL